MENEELQTGVSSFASKISVLTSILTIITFGIAIFTPPLSGPFCKAGCFQYPFTDITSRFPRDYYWMYFAMVLMPIYLTMIISIHQTVSNSKKHFSLIAVAFGIMASLVLITDYFLQVTVIQPSLIANETEGISLLSQFNPHGIFIALEEIGFIFMIVSFFCLALTFSERNLIQKAIIWTSVSGMVLTIISIMVITISYGIRREYRFEVTVISIAWLELIILGFLYFYYFKQLTPVKEVKY